MKTITSIILILLGINLIAQKTFVPDDNFEQALIDLGYDSAPLDDSVLTANINTITTLSISSKNISNLTGIEDFTALITLNCFGNQLVSLGFAGNSKLKQLSCGYNQLTSLDISENMALRNLNCDGNQLTTLDASNKPALKYLECSGNQLTSLDVSDNFALESLDCKINQLSSLDVSANTSLTFLDCDMNQLTNLDVSSNTALTYLDCSENQLTSLDVSSNTALTHLVSANNQLTSFDVSANSSLGGLFCYNNQLTSLDVRNGNNANIDMLKTQGNPSLECIYVDDKNAPYLNGWVKDSTAKFANNEAECSVSTNDLIIYTKFSIYPNPASDYFYFESESITITGLNIYSHYGVKIFSKINPNSKIDISEFKPGIYIVELISSNKSYSQKLVIN